jgi:2-keto-3-deoxy-L-rhamnonate aldolase RhmA
MCPGIAATTWSSGSWDEHTDQSNNNVLVIPLIETWEGVTNARQIAEIEGIDFMLFGIGDLTQDLGLNLSHDLDRLEKIWKEFVTSVHAGGARAGSTHGFGFSGYDFGIHGMDLMLLRTAVERSITTFRQPV